MSAKPKKIVFINQSTGYLTIDIINSFAKNYDEVALIYGNIRVQDVEIDPKVKKIQVLKKSRSSHITRFIAWFAASVQIFSFCCSAFVSMKSFMFHCHPSLTWVHCC
ncbi:MAG: hypothetical protein IPP72_05255 [Chitinophagaceae bacterium]|nr:hypothetical protein [Chitinophagaceae bacterium]